MNKAKFIALAISCVFMAGAHADPNLVPDTNITFPGSDLGVPGGGDQGAPDVFILPDSNEKDFLPDEGQNCEYVVTFSDPMGFGCGATSRRVWDCKVQFGSTGPANTVYYLLIGQYESSVSGRCIDPRLVINKSFESIIVNHP